MLLSNLPQEFLEQLDEACIVQITVRSGGHVEGHVNLRVALDVTEAEHDLIEIILLSSTTDCKADSKLPCHGRVVRDFQEWSQSRADLFGSQVLQCEKADTDMDLADIRYYVGQVNRPSVQVHRTSIAMVQGERDVGAKNGLGFGEDLLARSKEAYAFGRNASFGLVAFGTVDPVPASIDSPKAKSPFANMKELVVNAQSYLRRQTEQWTIRRVRLRQHGACWRSVVVLVW